MFRHTDYLQFHAQPEKPESMGKPRSPAMGTETGIAGKSRTHSADRQPGARPRPGRAPAGLRGSRRV
jgi:hypothetical protein